ncbi:MAG: hypothetical protein ACFB16_07520 [Phormidesmis sp.]
MWSGIDAGQCKRVAVWSGIDAGCGDWIAEGCIFVAEGLGAIALRLWINAERMRAIARPLLWSITATIAVIFLTSCNNQLWKAGFKSWYKRL